MGMNVNRGFFNFKPNWKQEIKFNPQYEGQQLTPEKLTPGNMTPKTPSTPQDLQKILENLDNPDIPKFE